MYLTNATIADAMDRDAKRRRHGMACKQLRRIAARLRDFPRDRRFAHDVEIAQLNPLHLLQIEFIMQHWYPSEALGASSGPPARHVADAPRPDQT